jgi:hypothetical protein
MELINFRWGYLPRWNSILQVGVSTQYSSAGSIHSDGHINFRCEYPEGTIYFKWEGVSTQREQYTSGGSIHPVLLNWEYSFRWNI